MSRLDRTNNVPANCAGAVARLLMNPDTEKVAARIQAFSEPDRLHRAMLERLIFAEPDLARAVSFLLRSGATAIGPKVVPPPTFESEPIHEASTEELRRSALVAELSTLLHKPLLRAGLCPDAVIRHSVATARIGAWLAEKLELDPQQAFACGVLHNVGLASICLERGEAYIPIAESLRGQPWSLAEAELGLFGASHADHGSALASRLGLHPEVIHAAASHVQDFRQLAGYARVTAVAACLAHHFGLDKALGNSPQPLDPAELKAEGVDVQGLQVLAQIAADSARKDLRAA